MKTTNVSRNLLVLGFSALLLARQQLAKQRRDLENQVRRLLDHCGLPFESACVTYHEQDRAVRTASSEQVRRPIYRSGMGQWQPFGEWLGPLREALGPEDILISDVGAHKMWIGRYYQCDEPNTCLIPNGFCSMGMPLPGSIAAYRLHPGHRIVGIVGDGDFLMNVQEMETAKRLGSNIVVMVWEDGGHGKWAGPEASTRMHRALQALDAACGQCYGPPVMFHRAP